MLRTPRPMSAGEDVSALPSVMSVRACGVPCHALPAVAGRRDVLGRAVVATSGARKEWVGSVQRRPVAAALGRRTQPQPASPGRPPRATHRCRARRARDQGAVAGNRARDLQGAQGRGQSPGRGQGGRAGARARRRCREQNSTQPNTQRPAANHASRWPAPDFDQRRNRTEVKPQVDTRVLCAHSALSCLARWLLGLRDFCSSLVSGAWPWDAGTEPG